jgi:hypothetical protein
MDPHSPRGRPGGDASAAAGRLLALIEGAALLEAVGRDHIAAAALRV